ncbi:MAG: TIGR02757 family protein [Thermodesulfobacteriota bacterium]
MNVRRFLDELYDTYNHREYVHPDPLEFVYAYDIPEDREIVAFVAAALAYGRVQTILDHVQSVLAPMEASPYRFLLRHTPDELTSLYREFRHRFASGEDLVYVLTAIRGMIEAEGSLYAGFLKTYSPDDATLVPSQIRFCRALYRHAGRDLGHLVPSPERGSACKRLNLFFRWMVRQDAVDPGGWSQIRRDQLIIPLDTHMDRWGRLFGFTSRRASDLKAALEITAGYRHLVPDDPVRYDFVLTRAGIRNDIRWSAQQAIEDDCHADL